MRRRRLPLAAAALGAALALTACGGGGSGSSSGSSKSITVAYQRWGEGRVMDNFLAGVKKQVEAANPGTTVNLSPIVASENDYYTKLQLMMRSPRTSPDVVYEDTFLINSDIQAGYLSPLDAHLKQWADWDKFADTAKTAAQGQDGKVYGIPDGTDTRALWYDRSVFAKAGLPADWKPKTWDDLLAAARAIKAKVPGVIPLNVYSGKAAGEASSMQGFEMLLYGTQNTLYDPSAKKWVLGSKGFTDSLAFLKTVYSEGLGPSPQQALDPQIQNVVTQQWMPAAKVGINLDGSWVSGTWLPTGAKPWPQWSKTLAVTPMPTQNGQAPGSVSLSGGWTWAISAKAKNPDLAWRFISTTTSEKNELTYDNAASQIAVRKDVAADQQYGKDNPTADFFTRLVDVTKYRPAFADYPRVSNAIQVAMEAVMTGQQSPQQAASDYDSAVKSAVGAGETVGQ